MSFPGKLLFLFFLAAGLASGRILNSKDSRPEAQKRPERKLFYLLGKAKDPKSLQAQKPAPRAAIRKSPKVPRVLVKKQKTGIFAKKSAFQAEKVMQRGLEKRPQISAAAKKPVVRKAKVQAAAPAKANESFTVQKARRAQDDGNKAEAAGRKLQSVPLLLFGDYEIVIEKQVSSD